MFPKRALFVGLLACFSACRGTTLPTDVVVIGVAGEPGTLFPPAATSSTDFELINQVFLRLADIGADLNTYGDGGFVPQLARSWSFEDSLTLVVEIDPDARWHDGVAVTAADVSFTFDVYRDPAVVGSAPLLRRISSVTARGERVVEFKFIDSYPEQFYDAVFHTFILPAHVLSGVARRELRSHPFGRNPIGSGRYRIGVWEPDQSIELIAVPNHHLGPAQTRRQLWKITPDPSARVEQLLAGEIDLISSLPQEAIDRVREHDRVDTVRYPAGFYSYMAFNFRDPQNRDRDHPLFGAPAVRRAISTAIDRAAMVEAVLGDRGVIPAGPVSPMLWTWYEAEDAGRHDASEANRLLDAANWRDTDGDGVRDRRGVPLEFEAIVPASRTRRSMAVIIQEQLRGVGVAMRVTNLESGTFNELYAAGRFDVALGSWNQDPTPSSALETWSTAGIGGYNYSGYSSGAFDSLATAAARTWDRDLARDLWRRAYEQTTRDGAAVWLYSINRVAGVSRRLAGVVLRPDIWSANLHAIRIGR